MMKPKRRGLGALLSGLILMFIVAPAVFGVGAWYGVKKLADVADSAVSVSQGGTIRLASGDEALIMVDTGPATSTGTWLDSNGGMTLETCAVTSPGGELSATGGTGLHIDYQGRSYRSAGVYKANTDGDVVINCAAGPTKVITGDAVGSLAGGALMPFLLSFGLAALAGLLGLILAIVGIVKLVRSNRERAAFATGGYQQGYGQPGYAPQPGYAQPTYGEQPGYAPPPPPGTASQTFPPPPGTAGQTNPPPPPTATSHGYPPVPGPDGSPERPIDPSTGGHA